MADLATATRTAEARRTFRAMASPITVRLIEPSHDAEECLDLVESIFAGVERECSRFDPNSDLMRANAAGDEWCEVGRHCFAALTAAYDAYCQTDGAFDPRVLRTLEDLGYDSSTSFDQGPVVIEGATQHVVRHPRRSRLPWTPELDENGSRVRVGPEPIDLGGIGKGLAVRAAHFAMVSHRAGSSGLVEAGGDLATFGVGPARESGEPRCWRVSVESPLGGEPVAVLDGSDAAVATSSVRLRSWQAGGRRVHHLIDPRTGQPGEGGLAAVTVLAGDPAWAEVWTKALFLEGSKGIREAAESRGLAALWVDRDGAVDMSDALGERVLWRVRHAQ